jgi:hypothetical protein
MVRGVEAHGLGYAGESNPKKKQLQEKASPLKG